MAGSPGRPPVRSRSGGASLSQHGLVKQTQVGNQPRSTCQLPRVGAASGTPQGAPNGLLGIWRVALSSEKADALRRDRQTPGGLSSPWLSSEDRQEKWPCGYMGVRDWSSLCAGQRQRSPEPFYVEESPSGKLQAGGHRPQEKARRLLVWGLA